jgi:hypothetical protein
MSDWPSAPAPQERDSSCAPITGGGFICKSIAMTISTWIAIIPGGKVDGIMPERVPALTEPTDVFMRGIGRPGQRNPVFQHAGLRGGLMGPESRTLRGCDIREAILVSDCHNCFGRHDTIDRVSS